MLQKLFGFDPKTMKVRTEIVAGITTFMTMAYILAINPVILADAGMEKGAVFTATALASALATILVAIYAKMPLAQAPSMGINAFFAYTIVIGLGHSWQTALAAVFVEGIVFILLTQFSIREKLINAIPKPLRITISAGLGLFIAFIGLKGAGIISASPATFVTLGELNSSTVIAILGIIICGSLMHLKVRGAMLFGILISTVLALVCGVIELPEGFTLLSYPSSLEPTFCQFDFHSLLSIDMIIVIFLLVFMDLFDTVGTLVATTTQGGLLDKEGKPLRMRQCLMSDAIATSTGAMLGTSTIGTYIESATGIAEGGRSGMTAFTTGLLFIVAIFMSPLFLLIPSIATCGALVCVGVLMMRGLKEVNFDDMTEGLPAFLTMLIMVLSYSIAEGIAFGIISYTTIKVLTGNYKQVHIATYILTLLLILRYLLR